MDFAVVEQQPTTFYAATASGHLWKTTNDGQSWEKISSDLTLADEETLGPSGGLITMDMNGPEIYATIFALAPSYHNVNTIWTGSDDGLMHITRDGGKTFECNQVSASDDKMANWLPNISLPGIYNPVEKPVILYTHGVPGEGCSPPTETEAWCVMIDELD